MYMKDPYPPELEWADIAPMILELHDYSLDPYLVRWPRLAWLALEKGGLTGGSSEIERLDTTVRAISLTHFHLEFLSELNLSMLKRDYDDWLEDTVTIDQLLLLLKSKYDWHEDSRAASKGRIAKAFFAVYPYHLQQIVTAVYEHFGSLEKVFESLIETATPPDNDHLTLWQLLSAQDFLRGAFEHVDETRIVDDPDREWIGLPSIASNTPP